MSSWLEWGSHPWWSGGPLEHTTDTLKIPISKDFLEKNGVVEGMFGYVFFSGMLELSLDLWGILNAQNFWGWGVFCAFYGEAVGFLVHFGDQCFHQIAWDLTWLVASAPLKNIREIGSFPQVGVKIKNILKPPCSYWSRTPKGSWDRAIGCPQVFFGLRGRWLRPSEIFSEWYGGFPLVLLVWGGEGYQLSKKYPTGPTERTPKPEYLIALATYLGVRW